MKVREIMVPTVDSIDAGDTIASAAARMAEDDIGAFPVLSAGKLVGILTDRDIAVRAVAALIPVDAPVRRVMTGSVATCSAEDDVESVLALMSREQVRAERAPLPGSDVRLIMLQEVPT
ncbi:MAG TPA: CBS domain-containing protein [Sphingomicrobium sp.]|nr:CBS domain-containing protein [Sphingomicrobium sp.]